MLELGAVGAVGVGLSPGAFAGAASRLRRLTVADCIQTTRFVSDLPRFKKDQQGALRFVGGGKCFLSPDGQRFAAALIAGDLERDGNWISILVGELATLKSAKAARFACRLFSRGFGSTHGQGLSELSTLNPPVWLNDSRTVVFRWEDAAGKNTAQALAVDAVDATYRYLTDHPTDVAAFWVNRSGSVLYAATPAVASAPRTQDDGYTVDSPDFMSLLEGDRHGATWYDKLYNTELFLCSTRSTAATQIAFTDAGLSRFVSYFTTAFSPDDQYAVVDWTPGTIPASWYKYTDGFFRKQMDAVRAGITESYREIRQLFLIDLKTAKARPLWDAPMAPLTIGNVASHWSSDGRMLAVGPTFLPIGPDDSEGLAGTAIAAIDVQSGRFQPLPGSAALGERGISTLTWRSPSQIEILCDDGLVSLYSYSGSAWTKTSASTPESVATSPPLAPVRVEVRENLATPPTLWAIDDKAGREVEVLDPNPRLVGDYSLGEVRKFSWLGPDGAEWAGLLYLPVGRKRGPRYPLVIQTRGKVAYDAFSLYGNGGLEPGLGPDFGIFAAQPLANLEIAVLEVEDHSDPKWTGSKEAELYMLSFEAAVSALSAEGIADANKVGLMGFSRSGWWASYALAHSKLRYAAAITADGLDGGYLQAALMSWRPEYAADLNGAPPFGDGLTAWTRNAPAFNAESITAPLQIQVHSSVGGPGTILFNGWELFTRLRRLSKPVELWVVPDLEHGSHGLQNPRQCLAAQQRAVDWWAFWLRGIEHAVENDQFRAWRELRRLANA